MPSAVHINGNVVTMDAKGTTAQAVAVAGGTIMAVGTNEQIQGLAPSGTPTVDLQGATVLPGFIDPHSHMAGYSLYLDQVNWIDVSGINVYFKPTPGDPRCTTPDDPQKCFVPVRNQDDVVARLVKHVAEAKANPSQFPYVLGTNYDASRLATAPTARPPTGSASRARTSRTATSANSSTASRPTCRSWSPPSRAISCTSTPPALKLLNICGTPDANDQCYKPVVNPPQDTALANLGQLNEDLAQYAIPFFEAKLSALDQGLVANLPQQAAEVYAQHGYTLVQEGTATLDTVKLFNSFLAPNQPRQATFPVAAALMAYESTSADYGQRSPPPSRGGRWSGTILC